MKIIISICLVILISGLIFGLTLLRAPNRYGSEFKQVENIPLSLLMANPELYLGKEIIIEGKVVDQCPATGCFFYFDIGAKKLRIELGDLAEKLPQKPGATAIVEGQLVRFGDSYQFLGNAVEFK